MQNNQFRIVILLFVIVSLSLALVYQIPQLFYTQDPIDPDNITDSYDPNQKIGFFENQAVLVPPFSSASDTAILGENSNLVKRIEVDLTTQKLLAFENDNKVYEFLISSGKYDRTPNGIFKIWTKIRSQKMSGGSKAAGTYYYLPNVPYIMFFYNDRYSKATGFSLHGTYWHNNFGVPMSHGCINMKTEEVAQLYNWAEINTPVIIYGKYQTKLPQASNNIPANKN